MPLNIGDSFDGVSQQLALEERVAHIEGILAQIDKQLDSLESRIASLDGRLNWTIGIMITMWISQVSLLVAILLKA